MRNYKNEDTSIGAYLPIRLYCRQGNMRQPDGQTFGADDNVQKEKASIFCGQMTFNDGQKSDADAWLCPAFANGRKKPRTSLTRGQAGSGPGCRRRHCWRSALSAPVTEFSGIVGARAVSFPLYVQQRPPCLHAGIVTMWINTTFPGTADHFLHTPIPLILKTSRAVAEERNCLL